MLSYMTYRHNYNSFHNHYAKKKIGGEKKSLAAFPPCQGKNRELVRKEGQAKKKKSNLATTHPSVTGHTPKCKPQERWIGI